MTSVNAFCSEGEQQLSKRKPVKREQQLSKRKPVNGELIFLTIIDKQPVRGQVNEQPEQVQVVNRQPEQVQVNRQPARRQEHEEDDFIEAMLGCNSLSNFLGKFLGPSVVWFKY